MTRQEIITELKNYFSIEELVCPHCFKKFGDKSWRFLDTELLHTILIVRRDILKVQMMCNSGDYTQRGLRCNLCYESRSRTLKGEMYLSAHCNGAGADFVFKAITAEKARSLIKEQQNLLPYNIRLEKNVSWLHIDCFDTGQKVYEFNT